MSRSEDSFCSSESIRTLLFSSSTDVAATKMSGGDMDNSQLEQRDGSNSLIAVIQERVENEVDTLELDMDKKK